MKKRIISDVVLFSVMLLLLMAAPTVGVTVVGPYGWYGPAMYGPSTVYVPREAATVQFENNKVVSWEKRK